MHCNFSRCPDAGAALALGGAALAMPKFVHRESIERLKKPRGTVASGKHGKCNKCRSPKNK